MRYPSDWTQDDTDRCAYDERVDAECDADDAMWAALMAADQDRATLALTIELQATDPTIDREPLMPQAHGGRGRTFDGMPLTPGANVDRVDIDAGIAHAAALGFDSPTDRMVVEYALWRHARGEEDGAQRTWLSYFPGNLTQWYAILAYALAGAMA